MNLGEAARRATSVSATEIDFLDGVELISSSKYITATISDSPKSTPTGGTVPVAISLSAEMPLGRFNEYITAKSSVDSLPEAMIKIAGTVIGLVEASPSSVRFLMMASAGNSMVPEFDRVLIINHDKARPLKILSYQDADDRVKLELSTVAEGQEYELLIRPKAIENLTGSVEGTIRIGTDHSDTPEVTVGYTIVPRI
ncbi:MAG: hypothetical protein ABIJ61_00155 [bacterium]